MKIPPLQNRWAACGLLLAAIGTLRLAAFAEEVVVKNSGSEPVPLAEAVPQMFTTADDVRIICGGILLFGEQGEQESCNSLGIGADKAGPGSALFVRNVDFSVARGISIGVVASGSIQLQKNSSLLWKDTLEVGAKGLLGVIFETVEKIRGGSMILDGILEIQFHSPAAIQKFAKAEKPLIVLSDSLRMSGAACVRIKLVAGAAVAPLPAGEYLLISGKPTPGDLPRVEIEGGDPGQQISLNSTPDGLFLVVNP